MYAWRLVFAVRVVAAAFPGVIVKRRTRPPLDAVSWRQSHRACWQGIVRSRPVLAVPFWPRRFGLRAVGRQPCAASYGSRSSRCVLTSHGPRTGISPESGEGAPASCSRRRIWTGAGGP